MYIIRKKVQKYEETRCEILVKWSVFAIKIINITLFEVVSTWNTLTLQRMDSVETLKREYKIKYYKLGITW